MARRQRPRIPNRTPPAPEGEAPPLIELERFSQASLQRWLVAEKGLRQLHQALFFDIESQRQDSYRQLEEALRAQATVGAPFERWARIVDYRYSNAPLSVAGSLVRIGGRFNIGEGINPAAFTPFPALYIAQDYDTAFRERFAISATKQVNGLKATEFALRTPGSFTHVSLRGQVESVIDAGDLRVLKPIAAFLSRCTLPRRVRDLTRQLGITRPMPMVRSATGLQRQLLHPHWRAEPVQFDLPANSQVFGRIAAAAGLHGILYPSARNADSRCLALFPQNWKRSSSFVEVMDGAPSGARLTRIDGSTPTLE